MAICDYSFASIGVDCAKLPQKGYTGRALLAKRSDISFTTVTSAPRKVLTITAATATNIKKVDNIWANAFSGSQNTLSVENGRPDYPKTVAVRVPNYGVETAELVEALAKVGSVLILEKEDGTYPIVGLYGKMTATEETQNETDNGGDWLCNFNVTEPYAGVFLVADQSGSNPTTAAEKFEALWTAAA